MYSDMWSKHNSHCEARLCGVTFQNIASLVKDLSSKVNKEEIKFGTVCIVGSALFTNRY